MNTVGWRRVGERGVRVALLVAALPLAGCLEFTAEAPRGDVTGCYQLSVGGGEATRAPAPPSGVRLSDGAFLASNARADLVDHYRFDARAAREAFFEYADTTFRVPWWWESESERRFGVGNHNRFAAFYIEGVVRGERFEGEMRRWQYDDAGQPVAGPSAWSAPVTGRRSACRAP